MKISGSYHMGYGMTAQSFKKHVDDMAALVGPWLFRNPDVTHLVGRGISGQLMVWPLAYKLGLNALIVRKPNEDAHSISNVGFGDMKDYAVVDDFISSGDTIRAIQKSIQKQYNDAWRDRGTHIPTMKVIFLYNSGWDGSEHSHFPGVPVFGLYAP